MKEIEPTNVGLVSDGTESRGGPSDRTFSECEGAGTQRALASSAGGDAASGSRFSNVVRADDLDASA
jgi:hypothetical protein